MKVPPTGFAIAGSFVTKLEPLKCRDAVPCIFSSCPFLTPRAGYEYSFPFLTAGCGVGVTSRRVGPLYKHLLNIHHPSMAFIGKEDGILVLVPGGGEGLVGSGPRTLSATKAAASWSGRSAAEPWLPLFQSGS